MGCSSSIRIAEKAVRSFGSSGLLCFISVSVVQPKRVNMAGTYPAPVKAVRIRVQSSADPAGDMLLLYQ